MNWKGKSIVVDGEERTVIGHTATTGRFLSLQQIHRRDRWVLAIGFVLGAVSVGGTVVACVWWRW